MSGKRDILLCDLDAFFASVEQLDNPELRGKPVIVGGTPETRGVVAACSYEARKYGVRSAMPVKKALELCPRSIIVPVNMRRYREVSDRVLAIFDRFAPQIEPVSVDEAYLAVKKGTGIDTARAIRSAVKRELELPISIGISANKLLSKIACGMAKPDSMKALWPEDVPEVLWPLPVRILPGVGPSTEKKLKLHGIKTVGDLAGFSEEALVRLLGQHGKTLQKYARGVDERELEPEREARSISEETTFPHDIPDKIYVMNALMELSEGVGYRLRRKGLKAKTISLKLRFADFTTITRDTTLAEGTDRDLEIYRTAKALFDRCSGRPPWRLVGVKAAGLEGCRQLSLFSYAPEKETKINLVKDRLRDKYGRDILFSANRLMKRKGEE